MSRTASSNSGTRSANRRVLSGRNNKGCQRRSDGGQRWNRARNPRGDLSGSHLLAFSLSPGNHGRNGLALSTRRLSPSLVVRSRSRHSPRCDGDRVSTALHRHDPIVAVLSRLGKLLEILLRVRPDLDNRSRLDQGSNLLPSLAVLLQPLQEQTVFFGGPTTGVFPL